MGFRKALSPAKALRFTTSRSSWSTSFCGVLSGYGCSVGLGRAVIVLWTFGHASVS